MSSLTTRDKRALLLLALVAVPTLVWYFGFSDDVVPAAPVASSAALPAQVLEKRLQNLRQQAALNPAKQEVREALQAALEDREKRLMRADTAQQVQAELLAKVRGVLEAQDPPMSARQSDLGEIRRLDDHYGEVAISVGFGCTIEQLVNVLADLAALEEMVATRQLNVIAADRAKKTLNVRLTMTALMPATLAPETSGGLLP
jgi:multidrug efflux pump subunit AcrA (membrane-fusion protein)